MLGLEKTKHCLSGDLFKFCDVFFFLIPFYNCRKYGFRSGFNTSAENDTNTYKLCNYCHRHVGGRVAKKKLQWLKNITKRDSNEWRK